MAPRVHSRWKHHSGRVYRVIAIANRETTRPEEYPITVVYQNEENGTVWSRPLSRWNLEEM